MDDFSTPFPLQKSKPRPKKRSLFVVFLLLVIVAILSIWEIKILIKAHNQELIAKKIDATIKEYKDVSIGVAAIDLDTNDRHAFGTPVSFVGASTTKIILATCFLHQVEQGKQTLDEQIGAYSAEFQLQQMVNQSNNDAWHVLADKVTIPVLQQYANSIGIVYDTKDNTITPLNEAIFLQKLYNGLLLNNKDTQLLLSYMQHTNEESLISAFVPKATTVYHKYGWLNGDLHDAAILVFHNHPVVVTLYTSANTPNEHDVQLVIFQKLTKLLFQYEFDT